jgi:DNA polymerase III subunit beta
MIKLKIEQAALAKVLERIQPVSEARNTLPLVGCALLEASAGLLTVTATDLQVTFTCSVPATVLEAGILALPAKKFFEIVRELPEGEEVALIGMENERAHIVCAKVDFHLNGLDGADFPRVTPPAEGMVTVESGGLCSLLEKVSHAMSTDETKFNLNGVFVKMDDGFLIMAATDGHRLAVARREAASAGALPQFEKGFIVPSKGAIELKKLCEEGGDLSLGFVQNSLVAVKGGNTLTIRLIEGEFPDYAKVVPAGNDKLVRLQRVPLADMLRRMSVLSSEKFKGVKLDLAPDILTLSGSNPEFGESVETLEVGYAGGAISLRFNARFLLDVLSASGEDEVVLKLMDEITPAVVVPASGAGFYAVVMPMRL